MQLTGTVREIRATQNITTSAGKPFAKRTLVIDNSRTAPDGRVFPSFVPVEFVQGNCVLLDNVSVGQSVVVNIDIQGRYYQPKDTYFVEVRGFAITAAQVSGSPVPPPPAAPAPAPAPAAFPTIPAADVAPGNADDLPF